MSEKKDGCTFLEMCIFAAVSVSLSMIMHVALIDHNHHALYDRVTAIEAKMPPQSDNSGTIQGEKK